MSRNDPLPEPFRHIQVKGSDNLHRLIVSKMCFLMRKSPFTLIAYLLHFVIYIHRDKTQRAVRGTLELSKPVDANGIFGITSSDLSLKLKDFPPSPLQSIPQLKSMQKLKNILSQNFQSSLIWQLIK